MTSEISFESNEVLQPNEAEFHYWRNKAQSKHCFVFCEKRDRIYPFEDVFEYFEKPIEQIEAVIEACVLSNENVFIYEIHL